MNDFANWGTSEADNAMVQKKGGFKGFGVKGFRGSAGSTMVSGAGKGGAGSQAKPGGATHPGVVNPFERKPSSKKYAVLGRVRGEKAQVKSLAQARSDAVAHRKETIGFEARQEGRSNSFIDRRFGESEDIPEEDKILMRFQVRGERRALLCTACGTPRPASPGPAVWVARRTTRRRAEIDRPV